MSVSGKGEYGEDGERSQIVGALSTLHFLAGTGASGPAPPSNWCGPGSRVTTTLASSGGPGSFHVLFVLASVDPICPFSVCCSL
jgi:hypothetical protein